VSTGSSQTGTFCEASQVNIAKEVGSGRVSVIIICTTIICSPQQSRVNYKWLRFIVSVYCKRNTISVQDESGCHLLSTREAYRLCLFHFTHRRSGENTSIILQGQFLGTLILKHNLRRIRTGLHDEVVLQFAITIYIAQSIPGYTFSMMTFSNAETP
jgi:hypothetical protein